MNSAARSPDEPQCHGGGARRLLERGAGCGGRELGFKAESSFEEIIRVHIEDELGGKIA